MCIITLCHGKETEREKKRERNSALQILCQFNSSLTRAESKGRRKENLRDNPQVWLDKNLVRESLKKQCLCQMKVILNLVLNCSQPCNWLRALRSSLTNILWHQLVHQETCPQLELNGPLQSTLPEGLCYLHQGWPGSSYQGHLKRLPRFAPCHQTLDLHHSYS